MATTAKNVTFVIKVTTLTIVNTAITGIKVTLLDEGNNRNFYNINQLMHSLYKIYGC